MPRTTRRTVTTSPRPLAGSRPVPALVAATASTLLVLLLCGCTLGPQYGILDRAPEPRDALPSDLVGRELDDIVVESLRFATEHDGNRLYVANGRDEMEICLLVDGPGDDDSMFGCSGGTWVVVTTSGRGYHLHPDGTPLPDDAYTDLTENISIVNAP